MVKGGVCMIGRIICGAMATWLLLLGTFLIVFYRESISVDSMKNLCENIAQKSKKEKTDQVFKTCLYTLIANNTKCNITTTCVCDNENCVNIDHSAINLAYSIGIFFISVGFFLIISLLFMMTVEKY